MDPRLNPYAPGAGVPPPELAGRADLIERVSIAQDRIRAGRAARGFIFHGLRGVGKTVLLNRIRLDAEARGFASVKIEAPEERSLPALLSSALRTTLLRLNRTQAAKSGVAKAMRVLASFSKALKVKYQDLEVGIDFEPEAGTADSGDLDSDLADLLAAIGAAAAERGTAVVLYLDELQYVPEDQLGSLIMAMHSVSQSQLPITMVAAGLPQLLGLAGRAKSYAERLFEIVAIDRLDNDAARTALVIPAAKEGVDFQHGAVAEILKQCCYLKDL